MSEEKKPTDADVCEVLVTAFKELYEKNRQAMYHLGKLMTEAPTYSLALSLKVVQDGLLPAGSTDLLSAELSKKGFRQISVDIIKDGQVKGH